MALTPPKRRVSDAENKLRLMCCLDALGAVTPSQLWPFVASLELMEYIPMQLLLHELIAGGDVEVGENALKEQLFLTHQGRKAFELFDQRVMASDRKQIRDAAVSYRAELQRRARVQTVYEMAQTGDYRVLLSLQEGELPLLSLRLSTPNREYAARAMRRFEGQAASVLRLLYGMEAPAGAEDAGTSHGPTAATLQSHSRHEHTVTALLPHSQAELRLSLLLPDAYAAQAYQRAFSKPGVAEETARRLMALLCEERNFFSSEQK